MTYTVKEPSTCLEVMQANQTAFFQPERLAAPTSQDFPMTHPVGVQSKGRKPRGRTAERTVRNLYSGTSERRPHSCVKRSKGDACRSGW